MGASGDGLVDDAVFNAALEEYKKAAQLRNGGSFSSHSRGKRDTISSNLRVGFGVRSGSGRNRTDVLDGRDAKYFQNNTSISGFNLYWLAESDNSPIREITVSGLEDLNLKVNLENKGTRKAILRATGTPPKNIFGTRRIVVTAIAENGHRVQKELTLNFHLPKVTFDTSSEDLKEKANEKPIVTVRMPGNLPSSHIQSGTQVKAFLVKGGHDRDDWLNPRAEGYEVVAVTLVRGDGTAIFTPADYKKNRIGTESLRAILAVVYQGTERPKDDYVSSLSDRSIQATDPIDRDGAKQEVTRKAQEKKNGFNTIQHLTDEEKQAAIQKVDDALQHALGEIDKATTKSGVDSAKQAGLTAIGNVTATADTRQGNSNTPGNATNQAGSDSRGDTASQGDRPAPSGDGSQGDANNQDRPTTPNAPAHSGNSTDQATGPSAQQRGTGNATEAESPQGLSGSSVTAPARSRRSVAFAGGAQSSQEKQVDKSVLRDLIQDLETRLKDLDGIDQSVIDAAKFILGEGQEALRNADLTEAGLKEMTAKIKEALESLKGKQATKDEEEMKETSKEQGHLPYGTMIGSLLALLGLLLFLIARRKKESELKKLTKELTKVLQEGDLTSVDAKVLDQAREALAQAVAFLANEKESDHTEDELIDKLKAILAQLR